MEEIKKRDAIFQINYNNEDKSPSKTSKKLVDSECSIKCKIARTNCSNPHESDNVSVLERQSHANVRIGFSVRTVILTIC